MTAEALNMLEDRVMDRLDSLETEVKEVKHDIARLDMKVERLDMKVEVKSRSLDQAVASGFAAVLERLDEKAP